jgi:hypothetical protein
LGVQAIKKLPTRDGNGEGSSGEGASGEGANGEGANGEGPGGELARNELASLPLRVLVQLKNENKARPRRSLSVGNKGKSLVNLLDSAEAL